MAFHDSRYLVGRGARGRTTRPVAVDRLLSGASQLSELRAHGLSPVKDSAFQVMATAEPSWSLRGSREGHRAPVPTAAS